LSFETVPQFLTRIFSSPFFKSVQILQSAERSCNPFVKDKICRKSYHSELSKFGRGWRQVIDLLTIVRNLWNFHRKPKEEGTSNSGYQESHTVNETVTARGDHPNHPSSSTGLRFCRACNKEFTQDEYIDHVYENPECYKAYLASEKKEMSKQ